MQTVPLASIAEVKLGRQRSPQNHSGPSMRKYLRAANVGWNGLILADIKTMNFTDEEMATFQLKPGDLLLNEASGSPKEVGKPALWSGEIDDCAFQNTLLRVRPSSEVDPKYLLQFFRQQAAIGAFARGSRGVGIHHLGREALSKWQVPLPPIDEQRRIAAILDRADAIRAKRRTANTYFGDLILSIFIDCFGAHPEATTAPLDEVAVVTSGITKGRKTSAPTTPVPFLAVVNVQAGHLNMKVVKEIDATSAEVERYALRDGDLVLTEGGDPDKLGRGTVWRGELPLCLHQNHIFRVRIRDDTRIHPDYLSAFIGSPPARSYFLQAAKQTTGIASINMTQLKALPVHIPPADKQQRYLDRLQAINARGTSLAAAATAQDELFASLQSRAFRGEL
ncbi:restriction endonuclease subunit S [Mycolicibacterium alvei]|nr:restriction endonuclease subunit S [Mycolicibacterium alvei]MCV6998922.1 restriction endonuclease subunit S [Mycolicibacterium alvei]